MIDRDSVSPAPTPGPDRRPRLGRLLAALLLALSLGLAASSCGNEPAAPKETVVDQAKQKIEAAGSNVEDLYAAREWALAQADAQPADSFEAGALVRRADEASSKILGDFDTIVASLGRNSGDKAKKLLAWAQGVIEKEKARPEAQRGQLATGLENHCRSLAAIMLAADPDNDALRREAGQREHVVDFASYLDLEFMDEDRDIKRVNQLIESIAKSVETTPSGKKWLPATFDMAEYDAVKAMRDERETEFKKKLDDPFERRAHEEFKEVVRYLREEKNLGGYQWVGRVHKPYLFIVERDSSWDESDVALKKFKQLEELLMLFHGEYDHVFHLPELEKPLPIIVFKRASAYREYAVGKTLAGALGHFEHGTDRIVLSDEVGRDTLFHEGTHQLVTQYTKGGRMNDFLGDSYWFQEGVAEYFGGTAVYTDPETKELRFELGVLQIGRLNYWRQNENDTYSLWDLIGLTFADRQANIVSGRQDKNLMVYSQGWFLVYFLYNYRINGENVVQIDDKPQGKYKEDFLKYFKRELDGGGGREEFLQCLGLWKDGAVDQAKFDAFNREFVAYYDWMNRKCATKYHMKDRKLIPWDKVENKGKFIGEKLDDTIIFP